LYTVALNTIYVYAYCFSVTKRLAPCCEVKDSRLPNFVWKGSGTALELPLWPGIYAWRVQVGTQGGFSG